MFLNNTINGIFLVSFFKKYLLTGNHRLYPFSNCSSSDIDSFVLVTNGVMFVFGTSVWIHVVALFLWYLAFLGAWIFSLLQRMIFLYHRLQEICVYFVSIYTLMAPCALEIDIYNSHFSALHSTFYTTLMLQKLLLSHILQCKQACFPKPHLRLTHQ